MKRKRLLGGLAIVAGIVAGATAVPTAASAGNPDYCDQIWVCIYRDSWWSDGLGARSAGFARQNVSAAAQDETSSWENRTASHARWYTLADGGGSCHNMVAGTELAWMTWGQNDELRSWAGTGLC